MGKLKRQFYKYLPYLKPLAMAFGLVLLIGLLFVSLPLIKNLASRIFKGPRLAYNLLTADTSSLQSANNRTNILVLGVSGTGKVSDLTDTMIFASIDKSSGDVVLLSIPRDVWLDSLQAKINTAYHYGEEKKKDGGFILAKDAVYEILNQPVHYSLLIDFEGFVKVVDLLGGIEIKVDRRFDDYQYPIAGKENDDCDGDPEYQCRYQEIHFEAGLQQMDGQTALKFIRSRNAEGEEGTDFARSQRQQKVILAIKDKILSYRVLLNPKKMAELKDALGDHIKTDYQFNEDQITAFLSLFIRFVKNKNQLRTISLDYGDNDNPGFLYHPPVDQYGQWVLIPRAEDWSEIHKYVKEKIEKEY
jgi:LCP family protein required for cell wall assembly